MKRWDKTVKISESLQQKIIEYPKKITLLILTESWCGDAAQTMPMMNKVAEAAGIDFKVVLRDENPLLMDHFLTKGARSIAKLILIDKNTHLPVTTWGPRPTKATALVAAEKAAKGVLAPEFKEVLQNWYNKDKGKDTEKDLLEILKAV
jgi:thiol-disulfide isomerase/thioredoxin